MSASPYKRNSGEITRFEDDDDDNPDVEDAKNEMDAKKDASYQSYLRRLEAINKKWANAFGVLSVFFIITALVSQIFFKEESTHSWWLENNGLTIGTGIASGVLYMGLAYVKDNANACYAGLFLLTGTLSIFSSGLAAEDGYGFAVAVVTALAAVHVMYAALAFGSSLDITSGGFAKEANILTIPILVLATISVKIEDGSILRFRGIVVIWATLYLILRPYMRWITTYSRNDLDVGSRAINKTPCVKYAVCALTSPAIVMYRALGSNGDDDDDDE